MAEKRAHICFRGVVAGVVAVAVLGACSPNDITAETADESATTTTSTTAPTTTTTTTSTTTTSTTTTTTTTTLPDPCAEFNSLTLSGQMTAIRNQQAPPNPECEPAVTNATKAVQTSDAAADMGSLLDADSGPTTDESLVAADVGCETTGAWSVELTNRMNYPIVFAGYYYTIDDEQATGIRMMQSQRLLPNTTVTDTSTIVPAETCGWNGFVMLGGDPFAPFDQAGTAPADDPQASDDPAVWFPALQDQLNIGRANGSAEYLIDHVYDLHSIGISKDLFPKEAGSVRPANLTYCASLDLAPPLGVEGEWRALMLTGDNGYSDDRTPLNMGVFVRGNDRRWRILSLVTEIPFAYDDANPCAAPPLI